MKIFNSITREKEEFKPIEHPFVGMYVCGPTVYSNVHLGNCRTFVSFDIVYRYLLHKGYKVRYVRNITDVGHLEGDADSDGEDKISKKAKLEKLEPMEIVNFYTNDFHDVMKMLNTLSPSIEPSATGHIIEQIEMVQQILDNGYAYERNGSVYFDTLKLVRERDDYGKLSGRIVDDLISESRDLKNQSEKNNNADFAIWVKADDRHIMRWNSPWSVGFPGWHLECSAMSTKYLGKHFDIHGGGMDLQFPHHENEIAQNIGACNCTPVNYWMHGNMLLLNGKKMSKTPDPATGIANSILPNELFSGENKIFSKAYSPMTLRFFMLQSHYRSTLDLTDEALSAAEKGYRRLMEANDWLQKAVYDVQTVVTQEDEAVNTLITGAYNDMDDDFGTPQALAKLFELVTKINSFKNGQLPLSSISKDTFAALQTIFKSLLFDVFGLTDEANAGGNADLTNGLMSLILEMRQNARTNKDWTTSDLIRKKLTEVGISVKDGKDGVEWSIEG